MNFNQLLDMIDIFETDKPFTTIKGTKIYDGSIVLFSPNSLQGCITNCL